MTRGGGGGWLNTGSQHVSGTLTTTNRPFPLHVVSSPRFKAKGSPASSRRRLWFITAGHHQSLAPPAKVRASPGRARIFQYGTRPGRFYLQQSRPLANFFAFLRPRNLFFYALLLFTDEVTRSYLLPVPNHNFALLLPERPQSTFIPISLYSRFVRTSSSVFSFSTRLNRSIRSHFPGRVRLLFTLRSLKFPRTSFLNPNSNNSGLAIIVFIFLRYLSPTFELTSQHIDVY